jgi:hypothetical protein
MTHTITQLITMPEGKTLELFAELKRGVQGKSFDEQLLSDRTVDDLESLRLVARHQGHLVPSVDGMLLFGKDREMVFPDAWIQCGRFIVYLADSMTTEVSGRATEQVTEQVRLLLFCLQDGPLGAREAMKCVGLNHRPTFLYDYLQPAIQAGFVEMTQPDSPKSPTQKYRLTAKGKAILATEHQGGVE